MLPRSRLLPGAALLCLMLAAPAAAGPVPVGTTLLVSAADGSSQPLATPVNSSAIRWNHTVSADGQRVVVVSGSDGLSPEDDDAVTNVYVKDRASGAVLLVSRATGAAGLPAGADSTDATISADGTKVAFATLAALDPKDLNGRSDVYVRDLAAGTTRLVSRTAGGAAGDADSRDPFISGDGTVVAFDSSASDFATSAGGMTQVFAAPASGGSAPALVSRSTGNAVASWDSGILDIADDGQRILFASRASNLVAGDSGISFDVFLRNRQAGTTTVMSAANGSSAPGTGEADTGAISGDGQYVAFASTAVGLAAGDGDAISDVFRRRVGTTTTVLVSPPPGVGPKGASDFPSISADGAKVAYRSASPIDPADADGASSDVYVTTIGGATELATRADGAAGAPLGGGAGVPALSADGTFVAFDLDHGGVISGDDPVFGGPYGRTLAGARHTELLGRPAGPAPFRDEGGQAFVPGPHALSADGRFALVIFAAPGLGGGAAQQLWRRDLETGAMVLASRADGPVGVPANGHVSSAALSADGRWAVFATRASNLDAADPSSDETAYLRDLAEGRTYLVSRADGADGTPAALDAPDDFAEGVDISDDGVRVAFVSSAPGLAGVPVPVGMAQVYVRDRTAGRTFLASRATGEAGAAGDGDSYDPALSGSGQRVAFTSHAANLGDGDAAPGTDVHLRDLAAGATTLVSATGDGTPANQPSNLPTISQDGARVAFRSSATNLDGADTSTRPSAYVRDMGGGVALASRDADGDDLSTATGWPVLSRDGGHVAFVSAAPELSGAAPAQAAAYERRLADGRTTTLLRIAPGPGTRSDTRIDGLALSADGGCALIGVTSPPLALGVVGSPDFSQVLARAATATCGAAAAGGPPGDSGGTPPPGGSTAPPPARRDRVAPRLSRVRVAHRSRRHALVVRFRLSERAVVRVAVERMRGARHRVVARQRSGRLRAGPRRVVVSARRLPRGRYRLTLTATDAAGNRSRAVHRTLTLRSHG